MEMTVARDMPGPPAGPPLITSTEAPGATGGASPASCCT
jgi:hypothetical protein